VGEKIGDIFLGGNVIIKKNSILVIILMFLYFGCQMTNDEPEESGNNNINVTNLFGDYLGQELPGATPIRFAPSLLLATTTEWWISAPKFSPDGQEMYFTRYIVGNPDSKHIYFMQRSENDQWTSPQEVSFGSGAGDCHVAFSTDGSKLFFLSHRPDGPFFVLHRNADGWSNPLPLNLATSLPVGNQFSVTRDETIYFELSNGQADDIYRSRLINGEYGEPESLGTSINTDNYEEYAPFIDPDEAYIIFASNRPGGFGGNDLYISFKNPDGSWAPPHNMGGMINSNVGDTLPCISPDGNYFFFITARAQDQSYNPYWVNASIIEIFRD
jgi:Tol biopolymer transport system component